MVETQRIWRHFIRSPMAIGAAALVALFMGLAVFGPLISPHNPYDLTAFSLTDSLTPPIWLEGGSPEFILGTDDQGRDILSTIIYGLRTSFIVGFSAVGLSFFFGSIMGLMAGYHGGWIDSVISRLSDMMLSFPAFLMTLLLLGILKSESWLTVILAISMIFWVRYARVMRGNVLAEKNLDYIEAARSLGAAHRRIIFLHLMPNAVSTLFVIAAVDLAMVIVLESTLSFLGVGVPLTTPSLGMLISSGYQLLYIGLWWIVAFPGTVLALLVLAINVLGDWLRQELNPRIT
jgi:peptide/nickel transport system permease protein